MKPASPGGGGGGRGEGSKPISIHQHKSGDDRVLSPRGASAIHTAGQN